MTYKFIDYERVLFKIGGATYLNIPAEIIERTPLLINSKSIKFKYDILNNFIIIDLNEDEAKD